MNPVLVCVFLRGGADTLNMLIPQGEDAYYRLRPTIAVPRASAIPLDELYALHPRMAPILPLYREGRFGMVQAVGTDDTSGSHFEAQDRIEHGDSAAQSLGGGFIGRFLRARGSTGPLASIAIGAAIPASLRGAHAPVALESLEELELRVPSGDARRASRALASLYGAEAPWLAGAGRATLEMLEAVAKIRTTLPVPSAAPKDDEPTASLKLVARLVKGDIGLEAACVDVGGWDTHFVQGGAKGYQADLIDRLARGLAAFDAELGPARDRVTTIVMTEFGRRVYENGSLGTDHGRGFTLFAMGAGIRGGRVHGAWPGLAEPEGPGPGGLAVVHDVRSVLAEVLAGPLGCRDLGPVFPGFAPRSVGLAG